MREEKLVAKQILLSRFFLATEGTEIYFTTTTVELVDKQPTNSVARVREWTIPTERPRLVGEVSVNFCG
jgi:hypothetical protein